MTAAADNQWLCPCCFRPAQAGIHEGAMSRLFCFHCDVSWHVEEAELEAGPLASLGDCVAVEPPRRRPSGNRARSKSLC